MYFDGMDGQICIYVFGVFEGFCGVSCFGYFEGVVIVVSKLLNMVQLDFVLFGEKDFQQLVVICKLVCDFNLLVQIFGELMVCVVDGLVLFLCNGYFDEQQCVVVLVIYCILWQFGECICVGVEDFLVLFVDVCQVLEQVGLCFDYLEICELISLCFGVFGDY